MDHISSTRPSGDGRFRLGPLIAYLPIGQRAPLSILHLVLHLVTALDCSQGSLVAMTLVQGVECRRVCCVTPLWLAESL